MNFVLKKSSLPIFAILSFVNLSFSQITGSKYYHYDVDQPSVVKTCDSPSCKKTAEEIKNYMDTSVKPCDDFHQFVCGNFIKKSIIDNEHSVNDSISRVQNQLHEQLKAGLEKNFMPGDPEVFKKLKAYYNVCLDEAQKEKNSVAEFKEILQDTLGGWPVMVGSSWKSSNFDWIQTAYKLRKKGFSTGIFFEVSVKEDLQDDRKRRIFLAPPSFGVNKEYFLNVSDIKIQSAYFQFMINAISLLNVDKKVATEEMLQVMNLEATLAVNSPTQLEQRDPTNVLRLPISELQRLFPYIPWLTYINTLFAPNRVLKPSDTVILIGGNFFYRLGEILAQAPKRGVANYIGWRMLWQSMNSLSKQFKDTHEELSKALTGTTAKHPTWKVCLSHASLRFPLAMGSLYVKRYFDSAKKSKIEEIIGDMRKTFTEILHEVDWMDPNTKVEALYKLERMIPLVAYPKELTDNKKLDDYYKDVVVDPKSLMKTELNLNHFSIDLTIKSLDEPVDPYDWKSIFGAASTTNAFYLPTANSIIFPAGILQPPFFNADLPKYVNFGSIGFIVGHEMTHGFDDVGRIFDHNGRLRDWWQPQTKKSFVNKTRCVVDQYSRYTEKSVGLKINGELTLGENIADNGGIKISYRAYNNWQKQNSEEPRLPGFESYTPKQLFWISSAHAWCTKYRPENLRNHMVTDSHSPPSARVIIPLSNRPEFAADFNCPKGSTMNPVNQCSVW